MSHAASSSPSFLRAVATVGSFTLLSRITGFARDILIAAFLGAGAAADAFFVAFQFPNLFRRLFAEGAFAAGFVPVFSHLLEKHGRARALAFAEEVMAVLTSILALFSAVMIALMPWVMPVIAPGFAETGELARATELARITFPYLFFISLVSLQSGVMNALDRFAAAAITPILLNLTLITFLLIAVSLEGELSLFLAYGVSTAGVVQFFWMWAACRRAMAGIRFVRPRLSQEVKDVLKRILPLSLGVGVYQINILVNNALATLISAGAVSWLYFADRVTQLPLGVVGVAVGVALLPMLSRQIQAGNEAAAMNNQNRAVEITLLLTLPAAAGIAMLSGPITATLFERGAFDASDRYAVATALAAFSIGLPAYVLVKALAPGFFGRYDTMTPVKISVVSLVINVVFALILMRVFGHFGIALATSLSAWINAGALAVVLFRRGHFRLDPRLIHRFPRIILATVIMMGTLGIARWVVDSIVGPVFGANGAAAGPEFMRVIILAFLITTGVIVFVLSAIAIGAAEKSDLDQLRRSTAVSNKESTTP
ncbi:MAG: murein biosynthesis integral membrane protein MurJ [Candidatus Marinimicrobia bacterium]|nr:murein biosynthesis integral membrane protein MurJ [Candidatus Neomarinimicrobiota bacterium]